MTSDLADLLTRFFEASLAVGLLVILVLCVRGPVARRFGPRAAYALWILPLLRLAMPPIPLVTPPEFLSPPPVAAYEDTAPVQEIVPVFQPVIAPVRETAIRREVMPTVPEASVSVSTTRDPLRSSSPAPIQPVSDPAFETGPKFVSKEEPASLPSTNIAPAEAATSSRLRLPRLDFSGFAGPFWQGLALLWAFLAIGYASRLLIRQLSFADQIWQKTIEADPQTETETRQLIKELGVHQPIAVRLCPDHQGPLVCGLFRPIIVVPEDFSSRFDATERRYALAHELLHVRRGDLLAILFMTIVQATQWFNPFASRAIRAFRADQEAACDASVLRAIKGQRHDYAQTLLKAVRSPAHQCPVPALTLDHGLKERLKLMNIRKTLRGGAIVVSGLAVLGLVSTASYAIQDDDALSTDRLDELLGDAEEDQNETEQPRRRSSSRSDNLRADLVRERVTSVRYGLGTVRDADETKIDLAALSQDRKEAAQRAKEAKRERLAEAQERQAEARERAEERKRQLAETRREAAEAARELRHEAEERRRELAEDSRERAAEAREWAADLRAEMADLRAELAEEARDIANELQHEIHIGTHVGTHGHSMVISDDSGGHQFLSLASDDVSVAIDAEDGIVLLTDPMAGLEERMAALENFSPEIPDIPEPPMPPEVVVVEVKTADGRTIKLPSETTIVLPTLEKDMEEYSRQVEIMIAEADIDGQVKNALGEDFDEKVRANTLQISKLTKQCEARKEADKTKPMIMTSTKNGVTHKILCFCPDETALNSSELSKFVSARSDLTKEEKKRFKEARSGNSYAFSFSWDE